MKRKLIDFSFKVLLSGGLSGFDPVPHRFILRTLKIVSTASISSYIKSERSNIQTFATEMFNFDKTFVDTKTILVNVSIMEKTLSCKIIRLLFKQFLKYIW